MSYLHIRPRSVLFNARYSRRHKVTPQTISVPTARVLSALTDTTADMLMKTSPDSGDSQPTLLADNLVADPKNVAFSLANLMKHFKSNANIVVQVSELLDVTFVLPSCLHIRRLPSPSRRTTITSQKLCAKIAYRSWRIYDSSLNYIGQGTSTRACLMTKLWSYWICLTV